MSLHLRNHLTNTALNRLPYSQGEDMHEDTSAGCLPLAGYEPMHRNNLSLNHYPHWDINPKLSCENENEGFKRKIFSEYREVMRDKNDEIEYNHHILEGETKNEHELHLKAVHEKEFNNSLKNQYKKHIQINEDLKKQKLINSLRIDELNSVIKRREAEIKTQEAENKELKISVDKETYGKISKATEILQRDKMLFDDPSMNQIPPQVLTIASQFREEYKKKLTASVFDEYIIKLNEEWERQLEKSFQEEKSKMLEEMASLRSLVKDAPFLSKENKENTFKKRNSKSKINHDIF